jgi:hypothetical protein
LRNTINIFISVEAGEEMSSRKLTMRKECGEEFLVNLHEESEDERLLEANAHSRKQSY